MRKIRKLQLPNRNYVREESTNFIQDKPRLPGDFSLTSVSLFGDSPEVRGVPICTKSIS